MAETLRLLGGAVLMVAGISLVGLVFFRDLAHVPTARWFEQPLLLTATAVACILLGGVLVAH